MKIATAPLLFLTIALANASDSQTMKEAEKAPLVIDSRDGLKCDREKLECSAEGEVIIRKGPYEIHSKRANAFMKKDENGKLEIRRVEAHDDVKFFGINGEKAISEDASYDLDKQIIALNPNKEQQVVVWKDEYVMLADLLEIYLKENSEQKLELEKIEASGHVSLSSPDELIEGDNATMTPANNLVIITGDVRANRKEGQLRGAYAQVNVDTKLSKVLKRNDDRVKVFVYPEEMDKKSLADKNEGSISKNGKS